MRRPPYDSYDRLPPSSRGGPGRRNNRSRGGYASNSPYENQDYEPRRKEFKAPIGKNAGGGSGINLTSGTIAILAGVLVLGVGIGC